MIFGVGWLPLLGVILLDLSLSPLKATVTSAETLSHWGGRGGEGFPQIKLRGRSSSERSKRIDGENRCTLTYLHPSLKLHPDPVFTPFLFTGSLVCTRVCEREFGEKLRLA